MQRSNRFALTWAVTGMLAVAGVVGACDPEDDPAPTPDAGTQSDAGTRTDAGTDAGTQPVDAGTDAGTQPVDAGTDAGTEPVDAGTDAGTEPVDAGTDAGTQTATLPLAVDGVWAASGYMGDGSANGIQDDNQCAATRPGGARGDCHHFTWTPGGQGWGGVYWQHPENNWGTQPGFEVPAGANSVSFYAWGTEGGEVVTFMTGMNAADGFETKLENVTLTTTPTQYTIDISRVRYGRVVGGFGWVAGGRTTPLVFFIDDIHWH